MTPKLALGIGVLALTAFWLGRRRSTTEPTPKEPPPVPPPPFTPAAPSPPSPEPFTTLPVPAGWKRLPQSEVTPAMSAYARQALRSAGDAGNLQLTTIAGRPIGAWTEWHSRTKKGITLLERA